MPDSPIPETEPLCDDELSIAIMQAVARGWCHPNTENRIMDEALALAITDEVVPIATDFIAHSRDDIPWLLARVAELEAEQRTLKAEAAEWQELADERNELYEIWRRKGNDQAARIATLEAENAKLRGGFADLVEGIMAWASVNENAQPPLDWTGLGWMIGQFETATLTEETP